MEVNIKLLMIPLHLGSMVVPNFTNFYFLVYVSKQCHKHYLLKRIGAPLRSTTFSQPSIRVCTLIVIGLSYFLYTSVWKCSSPLHSVWRAARSETQSQHECQWEARWKSMSALSLICTLNNAKQVYLYSTIRQLKVLYMGIKTHSIKRYVKKTIKLHL